MVERRLMVMTVGGLMLGGCVLGPDYQRPAVDIGATWETPGGAMPAPRMGDRWWELYGDSALNGLVDEALQYNRDLKVAIERVSEAEAQARYIGTDNGPSVNVLGSVSRTQFSEIGSQPMPEGTPHVQSSFDVRLRASYEIDFFGKYRRADEAARAELLAAESSRDTVKLALINQVVTQYFALLGADAQEAVVRRTLAARQETLDLDSQRYGAGLTSEFNLLQSQAEVSAARAQLAQAVQVREQQEAGLLLLLGRSPRAVMSERASRGAPAGPQMVVVPEGLPSDLLLRRPDLREAEQKLIAANARIGNVRSAAFPAISLTGYLGSESVKLADLFIGPAGIFQVAATIVQPVFQAGRTEYALQVTEARHRQAVESYQKAVASAFYDIRNALAAQEGARLTLQAQSERVTALEQAYQQALVRLEGGVASRLEALDTERQLLQAQLAQIDAERAQRAAVADLFKALGGGWGPERGG